MALKSTTGWNEPSTGATNSSGFTALPGGYLNPKSNSFAFESSGCQCYFWSSTEDKINNSMSFFRIMDCSDNNFTRLSFYKNWGYSVRCIQGNTTPNKTTNIAKTTNETRSSTQEYNSSTNECDKVVDDYLVFARRAIAYYNGIKKNPKTTSFNEYTNWDKEVRKQQEIVIKCVNKDVSYGAKILDVMTELVTTMSSASRISSSSLGSNNNSNSSSNNNTSNVCRYCAPNSKDGWHITDFNVNNRTYPNSRYVKRPGYIVCERCQGTGDCRVLCSGGIRECPGHCEEDGTCRVCHGERFVICKKCNGNKVELEDKQFVLCGSSVRRLKFTGANLLGGRAWRFLFMLSVPLLATIFGAHLLELLLDSNHLWSNHNLLLRHSLIEGLIQ
jgi:hypothetical protein